MKLRRKILKFFSIIDLLDTMDLRVINERIEGLKNQIGDISIKPESKEEPLFGYLNTDNILLDEAISRLRDNPDFEIFMKYLSARCESSFKQMHKGNKDIYDYWKGRINETDEIISEINYGMRIKADNERKKLDKERKKE